MIRFNRGLFVFGFTLCCLLSACGAENTSVAENNAQSSSVNDNISEDSSNELESTEEISLEEFEKEELVEELFEEPVEEPEIILDTRDYEEIYASVLDSYGTAFYENYDLTQLNNHNLTEMLIHDHHTLYTIVYNFHDLNNSGTKELLIRSMIYDGVAKKELLDYNILALYYLKDDIPTLALSAMKKDTFDLYMNGSIRWTNLSTKTDVYYTLTNDGLTVQTEAQINDTKKEKGLYIDDYSKLSSRYPDDPSLSDYEKYNIYAKYGTSESFYDKTVSGEFVLSEYLDSLGTSSESDSTSSTDTSSTPSSSNSSSSTDHQTPVENTLEPENLYGLNFDLTKYSALIQKDIHLLVALGFEPFVNSTGSLICDVPSNRIILVKKGYWDTAQGITATTDVWCTNKTAYPTLTYVSTAAGSLPVFGDRNAVFYVLTSKGLEKQ